MEMSTQNLLKRAIDEKADKNLFETLSQSYSILSSSFISNVVYLDTTQIITGQKVFHIHPYLPSALPSNVSQSVSRLHVENYLLGYVTTTSFSPLSSSFVNVSSSYAIVSSSLTTHFTSQSVFIPLSNSFVAVSSSYNSLSSSLNTTIKTQLNSNNVISGSVQVQINSTTGTLDVNKGGTGATSFTLGSILVGNDTSPLIGSDLSWVNNILRFGSSSVSSQQNLDVDSGSVEIIATILTSSYDAGFFDYIVKKGTDRRAGTVYAVHNGTDIEYVETSTSDIGNTNDVSLSVDIASGSLRLIATTLSNDWIIKTLVRGL